MQIREVLSSVLPSDTDVIHLAVSDETIGSVGVDRIADGRTSVHWVTEMTWDQFFDAADSDDRITDEASVRVYDVDSTAEPRPLQFAQLREEWDEIDAEFVLVGAENYDVTWEMDPYGLGQNEVAIAYSNSITDEFEHVVQIIERESWTELSSMLRSKQYYSHPLSIYLNPDFTDESFGGFILDLLTLPWEKFTEVRKGMERSDVATLMKTVTNAAMLPAIETYESDEEGIEHLQSDALSVLKEAYETGTVVTGQHETRRALERGTARLVFLAKTGNSVVRLAELADEAEVPMILINNKKKIGGALDRSKGLSAATITDPGIASEKMELVIISLSKTAGVMEERPL
jgi:large subunit ribosomal protein L7Ae